MSKLGYTWYPKDWGNSEAVFELTLVERGLYRELIDMAMLNDNQTTINDNVWARKFGSSVEEIESILLTLERLKLIEVTNEFLFIPSCESRLVLVRAGRKGGQKSKPNPKPISKPLSKPNPKQIEKKEKGKEKEIEKEIFIKEEIWLKFQSWIKDNQLNKDKVYAQFDKAWFYYEDLEWKNKNGKVVINPVSTIRNNWFKELDEYKLSRREINDLRPPLKTIFTDGR